MLKRGPANTLVWSVVGVALALAGCDSAGDAVVEAPIVVAGVDGAAALAADPSGGFWFGERLTGEISHVAGSGNTPALVARVEVVGEAGDQRGLLGLVATPDGRLFASWTRAGDGRLVVGQVAPDTRRVVWEGPVSASRANGGHLVVDPQGFLVIGVGDLLADRALADDPAVANRKLLRLDPDGGPGQRPVILSTGWNNPFAFVFDADGVLWVADNSPGGQPERVGRGDRPASAARPLAGEEIAPSGLVELDAGRLGVCGFLSGDLRVVDLAGESSSLVAEPYAVPCRLGATRLADGRILLASDTDLHALAPGAMPP